MGCFNARCSVSSISITDGTPVAFFPLLPPRYSRKEHVVKPSSLLLHPTDYFQPMSFPVFGAYNDYGSLENIAEDDNTAAIEAYFGITIEEFVALATDGRYNVFDSHSEFFRVFSLHQEIISSYSFKFDASFLIALGFVPSGVQYCHLDHCQYDVRLVKTDNGEVGYRIVDEGGNTIAEQLNTFNIRQGFLEKFHELTGYYLNVSKENQKKVDTLLRTSGMFVHRDIYDFVTKDKHNDMAGYYDKVQQQLEEYVPKLKRIQAIENDRDRVLDEIMMERQHPLDGSDYQNRMGSFFRDWPLFRKLYDAPIQKGKLKKEVVDFYSFYVKTYNHLYFPAVSGGQDPGDEEMKALLEKSLKVVNARIKKWEEW